MTAHRTTRRRYLTAAVAAVALVVAACGDDSDDDTDEPVTTEADTETTDADGDDGDDGDGDGDVEEPDGDDGDADGDTAEALNHLDRTGNGDVLIGVATPGPRDDGAFYQALVDKVEQLTSDHGFSNPIIVDNIPQAQASQELENLAQQNVDVLIVGAGEIADPMLELAEQYDDIFWYCSCGQAGYPESEFYALSQDDGTEINYTSGVATGLLLADAGGDSVSFIGCCNLGFEVESFEAFKLGLAAVDDSFTATYVATGDFNDVAAATEAFNNAVAEGADAIYPFLGGAHEPLVQLANENDLIAMSAGASDVCERTDLDYQIAIRFDAGDYLDTIFEEMISGEFTEGMNRVFSVGVDPEPGALICDPTPEQQDELDAAYALVASGDLDDDFATIKEEAYAG